MRQVRERTGQRVAIHDNHVGMMAGDERPDVIPPQYLCSSARPGGERVYARDPRR